MNSKYFYKDKPLFGLDIGFNSMKVMQVEPHHGGYEVSGYGVTNFDPKCIENGAIVDHEPLAKAAYDLFKNRLVGDITTRRVAFSVPAARTFSRIISLPKLAQKDLSEAVRLEAEQYIPVPIDDLYLDYTVTRKTEKNTEVLAVAAPKKVVDSYARLSELLGLEAIAMETTTGATARIFQVSDANNVPTVLIDFGSISTDITVYDDTIIVTGTVTGGGDNITNAIAQALNVTKEEAHVIKTKYGLALSKKQSEIMAALDPLLQKLVKEIKRMIRYYEERSGDKKSKIEQIVTLGGGANVPGLSEYLINALRMPVRACDPWQQLHFKHLAAPNKIEQSMYITVAGLALAKPKEVFNV